MQTSAFQTVENMENPPFPFFLVGSRAWCTQGKGDSNSILWLPLVLRQENVGSWLFHAAETHLGAALGAFPCPANAQGAPGKVLGAGELFNP